jgi:hypothetical protein
MGAESLGTTHAVHHILEVQWLQRGAIQKALQKALHKALQKASQREGKSKQGKLHSALLYARIIHKVELKVHLGRYAKAKVCILVCFALGLCWSCVMVERHFEAKAKIQGNF